MRDYHENAYTPLILNVPHTQPKTQVIPKDSHGSLKEAFLHRQNRLRLSYAPQWASQPHPPGTVFWINLEH